MRILILSPSCNTSLKSHSYKSSTSTVVICWNIVRCLMWLVIAFQHFCWWMPFKATLCDDHQTTGRPRHSTTQQRVANITDDAQMDKFFESWSYILFFSGLIFKKHLVGYLPDEFNFILFMLIKFGRYNPASRCSPSLLCCAWTKYRNRCAHKYHSTSSYSVIFMLQRSSLCICLNSRFFQYLVSHYVSFYLLPYHISSSGTEEARNSSVISHHSGSLVEHCVKMGAEMTKFKKARR